MNLPSVLDLTGFSGTFVASTPSCGKVYHRRRTHFRKTHLWFVLNLDSLALISLKLHGDPKAAWLLQGSVWRWKCAW